jgi:hypothetical protein
LHAAVSSCLPPCHAMYNNKSVSPPPTNLDQ